MAVAVAATYVVSMRLIPIYEATATIDIDRQTPSAIIGQESTRTMANDSDQFLATQAKLIQSDSVLRPVAQQYNLLETEREAAESTAANAPSAQEPPVLLKRLKVTRPPNTYLLLISYRSTDPRLAADVSNAIARSYLEHTYNIRFKSSASLSAFMERQMDELKAKMERSSGALAQFERELNVINPEQKTSILSARLLQLNTEYTNAQADRVRKEAAFKSVAGGTLEAAQVSTQGEALKRLGERIDEQQREVRRGQDALRTDPSGIPKGQRATRRVAAADRQQQAEHRPAGGSGVPRVHQSRGHAAEGGGRDQDGVRQHELRSFQYQAHQARGGRRQEPVRRTGAQDQGSGHQLGLPEQRDPHRRSGPSGDQVGVSEHHAERAAGAAVLDTARGGAGHPGGHAEQHGPRSRAGHALAFDRSDRHAARGERLAGRSDVRRPAFDRAGGARSFRTNDRLSAFQEAVRTLRNSILLTDFDRRIRSLMVTSSGPSEGKSTTAAHLALAHAQQGRRTLLIDGDLRRPSIHRRFDMPGLKGLSTVSHEGHAVADAVVRQESLPHLDILPAGPPSRRAADVVGAELTALLEDACAEYDLVILDSPPLLGFPEPLQMAASVDGVVVVALAGRTNRKALACDGEYAEAAARQRGRRGAQ